MTERLIAPDTLTPSSGVVKPLANFNLAIEPLDRFRLARKGIDSDQHRVELDRSFGDFEAVRNPGQEALEAGFLVHPDHGIPRPDHPQVADEGGPTWKNPRIRGRNMRVGPENEAGPAVAEPSQGDLLRARFPTDIQPPDLVRDSLLQQL